MGVHYLLAAIYAEAPPEHFDLDIYFRRPIFWDDAFNVVRSGDTSGRAAGNAMALTRAEPATVAGGPAVIKVLTEMRINSLG